MAVQNVEPIVGTYHSAYIMETGTEDRVITDTIRFMSGETDDQIIGTGELDKDGMVMQVILGATSLSGTWAEISEDGNVAYKGFVEFDKTGEQISGVWTMRTAGDKPGIVSGVWILTQALQSL